MRNGKPVITIDGPAASGKGTLAINLANHLGFSYLDTGTLYRMIGKAALNRSLDLENEADVSQMAKDLTHILPQQDLSREDLRTAEVSQAASIVSRYKGVRAALFEMQQNFARNPPDIEPGVPSKGAVMDGRDTGTVICPDADIKFYVTADLGVRVSRRLKDLQLQGFDATYDAVLVDLHARDERDMGRKDSPLKPAPDAIHINTTDMSEEEVFQYALDFLQEKIGSQSTSKSEYRAL